MVDYRFIIVDDHPLFRGALSQALSASFENAEIMEAGSLDELIERLATATDIDLMQVCNEPKEVVDAIFAFYEKRGFEPSPAEREAQLNL